ncbi:SDR family NAD(P)-dependent oxidoreductase [Streptomyces sp. NBC_00859]|uniref:SDR family NAD(P)-dependent oxidoreductase n=1 Tax=Streptomyces sp. NBC_00859 TaxID=2903682 RepID=UPI0038669E4E|nr:SDR family NAD(P)-dependent oxidoreductase [Streptomyces sp. NBC_00859]
MASALITTSFNAESTAMQVIDGVDLTGKRAIVTGASSGLGVETARALASAGAEVTLAVRDTAAGTRAQRDIAATTGSARLHLAPLDLARPDSVQRFAEAWQGPLDILVNNAGVMAMPLTRTAEGWEMQFATNHLGHFVLAVALHDSLAQAHGARITAVSSVGHIAANVDFDDPMFEHRAYNEWVAYGQSKTAEILFAVEATRRWADEGILVNALNPGRIPSTGLMRHIPQVDASTDSDGVSWKNAQQGAATSVLLAASPLVDSVGGRYFEDCNEAGPHQPGIRRGVAPYALDPESAARLWQMSLDLLRA